VRHLADEQHDVLRSFERLAEVRRIVRTDKGRGGR
jgi:hypothetical protein